MTEPICCGDAEFLELHGPPLPAWRRSLLAVATGAVALAGFGVALGLASVGVLLAAAVFAGLVAVEPAIYAVEHEHRVLVRLCPAGLQVRFKHQGHVDRDVRLVWDEVQEVRASDRAVVLETTTGAVSLPVGARAPWLADRIAMARA